MHFELLKCQEETLRANPGYEEANCASEEELRRFFTRHILIGYVPNTFVNKTMFDENPIVTLNDVILRAT